jgi:hypothetical protein
MGEWPRLIVAIVAGVVAYGFALPRATDYWELPYNVIVSAGSGYAVYFLVSRCLRWKKLS